MFRSKRTLVLAPLAAALVALASSGPAQDAPLDLDDALRALMIEAVEVGGVEAVALAISVEGEPLFAGGHGPARAGKSAPATEETPFAAGDLAHALLVTAALQLEAEGELDLGARVTERLEGLLPDDSPLRVGQLLAHSSGLPDYRDFAPAELLAGGASYAELLAGVRDQPLEAEPGTCVLPSATDGLLLAALIESASGRAAEEVLRASIFAELGMDDTSYDAELARARASEAASDEEPTPAFLPRGLRSSAADLSRYLNGLVELELFGSGALESMTAAVELKDGSRAGSGLGLVHVRHFDNAGFVLGEDSGAGAARLAYYPELGLGIALVARGETPRLAALERQVAALVIERPEEGLLDLPLDATAQRVYAGSYQLGCSTLVVRGEAGRLVLDELDELPLVLLHQGEHRFVARDDPGIRLDFEVEGELAQAFLLERHGAQARCVRFQHGAPR